MELMRCHGSCNEFCIGFGLALNAGDSALICIGAGVEMMYSCMAVEILKGGELASDIFHGLEQTTVKFSHLHTRELTMRLCPEHCPRSFDQTCEMQCEVSSTECSSNNRFALCRSPQ
jgi:hypothetical protein